MKYKNPFNMLNKEYKLAHDPKFAKMHLESKIWRAEKSYNDKLAAYNKYNDNSSYKSLMRADNKVAKLNNEWREKYSKG